MPDRIIRIMLLLCFQVKALSGQSIHSSIAESVYTSDPYLFYFHSGLVSLFGNNAINPVPGWDLVFKYSDLKLR